MSSRELRWLDGGEGGGRGGEERGGGESYQTERGKKMEEESKKSQYAVRKRCGIQRKTTRIEKSDVSSGISDDENKSCTWYIIDNLFFYTAIPTRVWVKIQKFKSILVTCAFH